LFIATLAQSHPFYGMNWYRPNHLTRGKDIGVVVEGLLSVGQLRENIDMTGNQFNFTVKDLIYYG